MNWMIVRGGTRQAEYERVALHPGITGSGITALNNQRFLMMNIVMTTEHSHSGTM